MPDFALTRHGSFLSLAGNFVSDTLTQSRFSQHLCPVLWKDRRREVMTLANLLRPAVRRTRRKLRRENTTQDDVSVHSSDSSFVIIEPADTVVDEDSTSLKSDAWSFATAQEEITPITPAEWRALKSQYTVANDPTIPYSDLCSRCRGLDLQGQLRRFQRLLQLKDNTVQVRLGFDIEKITHGCKLCKLLVDFGQQSVQGCEALPQMDLLLCSASANLGYPLSESNACIMTFIQRPTGVIPTSAIWFELGDCSRNPPNTREVKLHRVSGYIEEEIVSNWAQDCDGEDHKDCTKTMGGEIDGLTVIDCSNRQLIALPLGAPYVSLSYRWGINEVVNAYRDVLPSGLAPLIEDCILLVQLLDLRYLWIDRYCIPQDNPDVKRHLIQSMGSIYSNSYLTVIAAAGKDPTHSLPGVGYPRKGLHGLNIDGLTTNGLRLTPWREDTWNTIGRAIKRSAWNQRAWTYQEALLSRRRLVFTEEGLYFQCGAACATENVLGPLVRKGALELAAAQQQILSQADCMQIHLPFSRPYAGYWSWETTYFRDRVKEYNLRKMSDQRDALHAFQGIMDQYQQTSEGGTCFMGLPLSRHRDPMYNYRVESNSQTLAGTLLWHSDPRFLRNKKITDTWQAESRRRKEFPSWTWLGWKFEGYFCELESKKWGIGQSWVRQPVGSIAAELSNGRRLQVDSQLDEVASEAKMGINPALLHLNACVIDLDLNLEQSFSRSSWVRVYGQGALKHLSVSVQFEQALSMTAQNLKGVILDGSGNLLVVSKFSGSEIFERVGIGCFHDDWPSGSHSAQRQDIVLG